MMKKLICLFATILFCLTLPLVLASCGNDKSLEERGYTVKVTYDFNGGILDETRRRVIYYKPGDPLIVPGENGEVGEPNLDTYHKVKGWYRALTDEEGNPRKDAEGNFLTEDTPYDFTTGRAEESMTLVALWRELPTITIVTEGREDDVRAYEVGDSVKRFTSISGRDGYTFLDYYLDEARTVRATFPLEMEEGTHLTLYTKWLDGDVLVLRTPSDFSKLKNYSNKTVYLDADIDFAETRSTFPELTSFSGTFLGNGHTIRNLHKTVKLGKNSAPCGLFGLLTEAARIENLTLENVTYDITLAWNETFSVGLLAGTARAGAAVRGITLTDCAITYTRMSLAAEAYVQYGSGERTEGVIGNALGEMTYEVEGTVPVTEVSE